MESDLSFDQPRRVISLDSGEYTSEPLRQGPVEILGWFCDDGPEFGWYRNGKIMTNDGSYIFESEVTRWRPAVEVDA